MVNSHILSGWMMVLLFRRENVGEKEGLGRVGEREGVEEMSSILVILSLKCLWDICSMYCWMYSPDLKF